MAEPGDPAELAPSPEAESEPGDSLIGDLKDLAGDTRTALEAELAYQSARARLAGGEIKQIALWSMTAAMFAFVALIALAVGAVVSLAPLMGGVPATLAVVFVLSLGAAAAAIVAYQGVRGLKRIGAGRNPDNAA